MLLMHAELNRNYPEFSQLSQCPRGELPHGVIEETQWTERIVDAVEGVVGQGVQGVAFQIERRQRLESLEDVVLQPAYVVLRQVEKRQRRQRCHRRRNVPQLRTFGCQFVSWLFDRS